MNFPIVLKIKHVYTLLICFSCSFQRRHSLIRLTKVYNILYNIN
nr:MAG TPA: hypothetical protein [Caudoviricetes sp.]